MTRIKYYLRFAFAGLILVLPVFPAAANDNAPKPASHANPAATSSLSCTGHLDQPMSDAFYTHCLAPADGRPALQASNDAAHRPSKKCATASDHTGPATCELPPAALIHSPTPRHGSKMDFISLEPVPFEFNKSNLTDGAEHVLDTITTYLHDHPGVTRVLIYGNTDNVGAGAYNYTLSDKRIRTVTAYLVEHGISPSLLHEAPRGERMPVDEYWTPEGRERNRRVQLYAVVR